MFEFLFTLRSNGLTLLHPLSASGVLFTISLSLTGCLPASSAAEDNNQSPAVFFDVEQFFQAEIDRLKASESRFRKMIKLQGEEEQIEAAELDFENELQVFLNSDINRIAWEDKYRADSTYQGDKLVEIRYQAIDTTLKTKLLEIDFENGKVVKINILNTTNSLVAQTKQKLKYEPKAGYFIDYEQKILFSKKRKLIVEVDFT